MYDGLAASRGASTLDTLSTTPGVVKDAGLSIVTRVKPACAGITGRRYDPSRDLSPESRETPTKSYSKCRFSHERHRPTRRHPASLSANEPPLLHVDGDTSHDLVHVERTPTVRARAEPLDLKPIRYRNEAARDLLTRSILTHLTRGLAVLESLNQI